MIQHVSDTAFWVAAHRAQETKRKDALFQDPFAQILIGERGQQISDSMKKTARYSYWSIIMRTRIIDELILSYIQNECSTVINMGAGLDTRPYRLNLPRDLQWVEVDFQHVVDLKNEKLKNEKPRCQLTRMASDLSDRSARQKLFKELEAGYKNALILTEGVIPYLTESMVAELADDLKGFSQAKYWIVEYYSPKLYPRFQAPSFSKLLGNAPFRFFPQDWFAVFAAHGWTQKEARYLYDEGEKNHRPFPLPWWAAFLKVFANPEKFAQNLRLQSYAVLKKSK